MSVNLREERLCPACLSSNSTFRFWTHAYASERSKSRFRCFECGDCGSLFLRPIPPNEELREFYPSEYHPIRNPAERIWKGLTQVSTLLQMGLSSPTAVFDWGCGGAELIEVLLSLGIKTSGFELVPYYWPTSIRPFVLTDETLALEALPSFGTVTMLDVLEHIADPGALLSRILSHGAADIYVFMPRADGPEIRRFGGRAYIIQAPNHVWLPTLDSLRKLACRTGWELVPCDQPVTGFWDLDWLIYFGGRAFSAQGSERIWDRVARRLARVARLCCKDVAESAHIAAILKAPRSVAAVKISE